MAAGNQLYDTAALFLNQQLTEECEEFDVEHISGAHPIVTMAGFKGISPGAPMTNVSIKQAIPRAGITLDFLSLLQGNGEVELVYFRGGKKARCKGFLMSAKENFSATNPSALALTFVGAPVVESTL